MTGFQNESTLKIWTFRELTRSQAAAAEIQQPGPIQWFSPQKLAAHTHRVRQLHHRQGNGKRPAGQAKKSIDPCRISRNPPGETGEDSDCQEAGRGQIDQRGATHSGHFAVWRFWNITAVRLRSYESSVHYIGDKMRRGSSPEEKSQHGLNAGKQVLSAFRSHGFQDASVASGPRNGAISSATRRLTGAPYGRFGRGSFPLLHRRLHLRENSGPAPILPGLPRRTGAGATPAAPVTLVEVRLHGRT